MGQVSRLSPTGSRGSIVKDVKDTVDDVEVGPGGHTLDDEGCCSNCGGHAGVPRKGALQQGSAPDPEVRCRKPSPSPKAALVCPRALVLDGYEARTH